MNEWQMILFIFNKKKTSLLKIPKTMEQYYNLGQQQLHYPAPSFAMQKYSINAGVHSAVVKKRTVQLITGTKTDNQRFVRHSSFFDAPSIKIKKIPQHYNKVFHERLMTNPSRQDERMQKLSSLSFLGIDCLVLLLCLDSVGHLNLP